MQGLVAGASLLAGCGGSSTGPGDQAGTLRLTAPATLAITSAYTDATGQRSLGCTANVDAAAAGQDVALDSARITYVPTKGGSGRVVRLSAQDAATLWGAAAIPAGTTRRATITFRDAAVFTAQIVLAYHAPGGVAARATAAVRCVAPILGTYVLTSINGAPLPAESSDGLFYADTLAFAADLTYTTGGRWDGSAVYGLSTPPAPYGVSGPDSVVLPAFLPGFGAGDGFVVAHTRASLSYTLPGCCGRPDHTFRFDSVAAAP